MRAAASAAAVGIAVAVPVFVLAYLVRSEDPRVIALDEALVAVGTEAARGSLALRRGLLGWQEGFQARWVNLAALLVCLWAWRARGLASRALWAAVTIVGAWGLGLAVKLAVQRARPVVEEALTDPPGYSFPSGHATNTAATGLTVVLLLWPVLGPRARVAVPAGVAVVVVATAVDRVMLGAHYPSDVVAGIALGASMALGSYVGYRRWNRGAPSAARSEA